MVLFITTIKYSRHFIGELCYTYNMKYKALFFDMDGVIVDSEPAHAEAFKAALSQFGIHMTQADYAKYFSGKPGPQAMADFFKAKTIDIAVDSVMAIKQKWYLDTTFYSIKGYPDTIEFIKRHVPYLPYGLVTSSPLEITVPTLEKYGLLDVFKVVVTLDDINRGKPDPEGYLLAASKLGVDPNGCAAIEDSPAGV